MPEREPSMHPEVAAALRAYEIEMRDGTERSQEKAFRALQERRRILGSAAITSANDVNRPPQFTNDPGEQLAAS